LGYQNVNENIILVTQIVHLQQKKRVSSTLAKCLPVYCHIADFAIACVNLKWKT